MPCGVNLGGIFIGYLCSDVDLIMMNIYFSQYKNS